MHIMNTQSTLISLHKVTIVREWKRLSVRIQGWKNQLENLKNLTSWSSTEQAWIRLAQEREIPVWLSVLAKKKTQGMNFLQIWFQSSRDCFGLWIASLIWSANCAIPSAECWMNFQGIDYYLSSKSWFRFCWNELQFFVFHGCFLREVTRQLNLAEWLIKTVNRIHGFILPSIILLRAMYQLSIWYA